MVGEPGLVRRDGRAGLGLVGDTDGEWRGVRLGVVLVVVVAFLKGLLDTSLVCTSGFSGEAWGGSGGIGGLILTLVGDNLGGSGGLGGWSSLGEADLTVLTEAVEEMESELEVRLSLEGDIGDLPVPVWPGPRSSVLFSRPDLVFWAGPALVAVARSSWELDLARWEPNW